MFVCVHSTLLGPAMGGTRMKSYATPAEALEDGLRLAAGMTRKLAVLGLPCGGGKAVLHVPAIPNGDERRRLVTRFGDLIESLGGSYVTGPDVNTGEADMDAIGERTRYVFCRSAANGGSGDPSIHTAKGVFHGIRASLRYVHGSDELAGRRVLVQGAGSVGGKLAALLAEAGATVLVSDVDEERARATRRRARPGRGRAHNRVRRLRAVRARRDPERGVDSPPALRHRRGWGEQPARDRRGRRAAPRGRDPLRARLRHQRRRRATRDRARAPRLGRRPARARGCRDRRHAGADLRRGRLGGDRDRGGGRAACGSAAQGRFMNHSVNSAQRPSPSNRSRYTLS